MAKRNNIRIVQGWIAALLITLFPSCEYVDFYDMYDRSNVDIIYQWDNVGTKPKAMRLVLYPADELTMDKVRQGYMIYDLYSDGRNISLPVGKFHVTTWNTDVSNSYFHNQDKRELASVTTTPLKSENDVRPPVVDSLFGHRPILYSPEYMVRKSLQLFTVEADKENQKMILRPDSMISTVNVEISGIKSLGLATKVSAAIGVVPGTAYMADTTKTENPVVWMFDCSTQDDKGIINGQFFSYDLGKSVFGAPHDLCIFIWTSTGNIYIPLKVNIPEEILSNRFIPIKIRLNVDLKDYVTQQDGFDVEVGDWDDVEIEIPM